MDVGIQYGQEKIDVNVIFFADGFHRLVAHAQRDVETVDDWND